MILDFSSREELRLFLNQRGDWRAWLSGLRSCKDRIFIKDEPILDMEIEQIMEDKTND